MPTDQATRAARHQSAKTPRTKSGAPNPTSGSKGDQAFASVPGKGLVHFVKGDTSWKEMSTSQSDFSGQVSGEGVTIRTSGGVGGGGNVASSGLTQLTDSAATPGGGGQYNGIPSGHVNLIYDSGALGTTAKIYNIKSANANLLIEDDEDVSGNAFIKLTAQDQSVSLHRYDTVYAYDDGDDNKTTAPADGADGIAFVDTTNVTWTVVAPAGSGEYTGKAKVSCVTANDNDNTTYSINASSVSGGANFNLAGINPTSTDTIKLEGAGRTTVTRTNADTITLSSSDQYTGTVTSVGTGTGLTGTVTSSGNISLSHLGLESLSDPGADRVLGWDESSNALKWFVLNSNITSDGTNINSTDTNTTSIASTNAQTGDFFSLREDASTIKALKKGTGINMTTDTGSGGDVITISSTVDTSGLLTNGIVKIEDWNGSEVEDEAPASGPDVLRFADNDGIEWAVSGPSGNTITVTPSLEGYNASNWNTAYTHSQSTHAPTDANNYSHPTSAGNKHVPSGGSSGQFLKYSSSGTAVWATPSYTTNTDGKWDGGSTDLNASNGRDSLSLNTTDDVRFDSFGVGTNASGTTGEIRATNEVTAYYSDDRLKNKYGNIENALEKVCSLNGFHYQPNETAGSLGYDTSKKKVGVSAQEVLKVLPEAVTEAPIDPQYHTVQYEKLVPLLVEAIKELNERKCSCGTK